MTQTNRPGRSGVRTGVGIIIALVFAILAPLVTALSGIVFIYPVLAVVLYACCGIAPAAVSILANVLAFDLYFGLPGALCAVVAFALPSAFMIRYVKWARPFRDQVLGSVVAQVLGMLAALVVLRLYIGKDILTALTDILRTQFHLLEPGIVDMLLGTIYKIEGIIGTNAITQEQLAAGMLDAAQREGYIAAFLNELRNIAATQLPGMLLASSVLTGLSASFLSSRILRRNENREGCYVPIAQWFTPWKITASLLILLAISYVLVLAKVRSSDVIYSTIIRLAFLVFRVQTCISLERRMQARGFRPFIRVLLIALVELILIDAAIVYGMLSAMTGSTGMLKQLRERKNQKSEK